MTKEQKCIELLIYHIDGLMTYSELVCHLAELDTRLIESFPDNTKNIYPPLKKTLRQTVLQAKENNATHKH